MPSDGTCFAFKARSSERHPARFPAQLLLDCGAIRPVEILNISTAGVALQANGFIPIGSTATLRMTGTGDLEVSIRWQMGGRAGGAFKRDMADQHVRDIVAGAPVPEDTAA